jgi:hypothetical protein
MHVSSQEIERSCICVLVVMYLRVSGIYFAYFYHFSIWFWKCSDSVVFCLFLILFPFTEIVSLFYHRQRNWLWVKQRVSYKKRELLTLREHLVLWWGTFCDGVRVVMGYVLWWGTFCDRVRVVMGYALWWGTFCDGVRVVMGYALWWGHVLLVFSIVYVVFSVLFVFIPSIVSNVVIDPSVFFIVSTTLNLTHS